MLSPATCPPAQAETIAAAGRRLDQRDWVPATAGNISLRLDGARIAITRSGVHKGFLEPSDVIVVDPDGRALADGIRPSAETLLHCQLYAAFPAVGAVVHGHSVAGTVLSMAAGAAIRFAGYEVQKVFQGQSTHDAAVDLPIVDNDQDIARLATRIAPLLTTLPPPAYLIRGHGTYVWGPDMPSALARFEGLEFLLACELESQRLKRGKLP